MHAVPPYHLGDLRCRSDRVCVWLHLQRQSKFRLHLFISITKVSFTHLLTLSLCLQIKGDLEKSMSDVFQKYDGLNGETHAVDYLQTQVSCITSVCLLRK